MHLATVDKFHPQFPPKLRKLMKVAKEKGSSSWLVALPIETHGFALHESSRDAICLRYMDGSHHYYQQHVLVVSCLPLIIL